LIAAEEDEGRKNIHIIGNVLRMESIMNKRSEEGKQGM
jgi:hypothetical protein